ncbi:MAG TPA: ribosome maturation factor RimP [Candidatus Hydrogenedens sp.]|nr:ribosome maturation factor RimP [Candidatus Hydrogenedens sp.]HPP57856.1 ribosome maturation factor RimP [Candidatus Hydrogenedens sp.]
MSTKERIKKLWMTLEPYVIEKGFELIELEFGAYGKSPVLRVYIENPTRPITIDDCTEVSYILSNVLDTIDMEEQSYILEVSSPGFDRPLRREKDFVRFAGETVRVQTDMPVNGRKNFKGVLQGIDNEMVLVDVNGEILQIHLENLKHANLVR